MIGSMSRRVVNPMRLDILQISLASPPLNALFFINLISYNDYVQILYNMRTDWAQALSFF